MLSKIFDIKFYHIPQYCNIPKVVVEVVVVVVIVVVVIVVVLGAQQSNPSGNSAPQLSKLSWQKRPGLQWESLSQSPSPCKHGHSSLQHAKSWWALPHSDGQPK